MADKDTEVTIYLVDLLYSGCPYGDEGEKLQCSGGNPDTEVDDKTSELYAKLREITAEDARLDEIIKLIWEMQGSVREQLCLVCKSCSGQNPGK